MFLVCFVYFVVVFGCSINLDDKNLTKDNLQAALISESSHCPSPDELYLNNNQLEALPESIQYTLLPTSFCSGTSLSTQKQLSLSLCQSLCSDDVLCSFLMVGQETCSLYTLYGCNLTTSNNNNTNDNNNGSNVTTNATSIYRKDVKIAGMENFKNLTVLDISNNLLTSLSLGITSLTSLATLELENNRLSALPLGIFPQLPALRVLNVKSNNLTTISQDVFTSSNLGFLDLGFNQLSTISTPIFQNLVNLTALYLNGNPLISLTPNTFSGLNQLTDLQLNFLNQLTSVSSTILQGLTNLSTIQITHTNVTSLPSDLFRGLGKLANIDLRWNLFSALPRDIFTNLTLTQLQIDSPPACTAGTKITTTANCSGVVVVGGMNRTFVVALPAPPSIATDNNANTVIETSQWVPTIVRPSIPPSSSTSVITPIPRVVEVNAAPSLGVIVGTVLGSLCALKIVIFVGYVYIKRKLRARRGKAMENAPGHMRNSSAAPSSTHSGPFQGDVALGPYLGRQGLFYADGTPTHVNFYRVDPTTKSAFTFVPSSTVALRFYDEKPSEGPALPVFTKGNSTYTAVQLLGKGNFGTAYLAIDAHKNIFVVKTIICKDHNVGVKEAKNLTLNTPSSPHLLKILDFFFETDQTFCIVLNYCGGGSLQDYVLQKLDYNEVERILREIATGLDALHGVGMIHRDLKPDNVFLLDHENRTVVIGDMGMARRINPDGFFESSFGHMLYKAPEIVEEGKFSTRSDMWAVGCIGLELLSGESLMTRYASTKLIINKATSEELSALLEQLPDSCKQHTSFKMVSGLLLRDPVARLTANQIKSFASDGEFTINTTLSPCSSIMRDRDEASLALLDSTPSSLSPSSPPPFYR